MNYTDEANEAIILLQNLISISSFSKEEDRAADFLENYILEKGYECSRIRNNLWIICPGFDLEKPTILLNSHIDTVKPTAAWRKNPFTPTIENKKLYGLGSNDAGASLVSLLYTFFILSSKKQKFNLIFAASAEEEISGINGIETLLKELPKIDFAIIGEPTQMKMAIAEKGLMVIDCLSKGIAGHAARCEGENAIYKAFNDIEWFKSYFFEKESELLGKVKMSVTQINAGTQHNVIPDECKFVVDIRSNEMYTNTELLDEIKKHVTCEVKARSIRLSSTATPRNHPVIERGKTLGLEAFGSPTLSDQALINFPSMKIGPGDSARSHTADEYIYLSEIEYGISVYVSLLDNLSI